MISKTIGFRGTQHFQTHPHGDWGSSISTKPCGIRWDYLKTVNPTPLKDPNASCIISIVSCHFPLRIRGLKSSAEAPQPQNGGIHEKKKRVVTGDPSLQLVPIDDSNIRVCLKIGYIPNEIAIFRRDNDQQNHWVFRGTNHFQTNPNMFEWKFLCVRSCLKICIWKNALGIHISTPFLGSGLVLLKCFAAMCRPSLGWCFQLTSSDAASCEDLSG